jgi:Putative lipoprotein
MALSLILGCSLTILGNIIGISHHDMILFFVIFILSFIVIGAVFNLINIYQFNNRYRMILPILNNEKDTKRFIGEMIKLVNKAPRLIQNLFEISLATGYSADGNGERALQILTSVDPRNLSEINQATYYLNLFAITYNLGDEMDAISILDEHYELLQRYENNPNLSAGLAVNMVFRYITEKDYDKARISLEKADCLVTTPYLKDTVNYLRAVLLCNDNRYDEARRTINILKEQKLTPSLLNKISKLEESLG